MFYNCSDGHIDKRGLFHKSSLQPKHMTTTNAMSFDKIRS